MSNDIDIETIRQVVKDAIREERGAWNYELTEKLKPIREFMGDVRRDLYGINPDGTKADDGFITKMTDKVSNGASWSRANFILALIELAIVGILLAAVLFR